MDWLWQTARVRARVAPPRPRDPKDYHARFNRKECINFVPSLSNGEQEECYCGLKAGDHVNALTGYHPFHTQRFSRRNTITVPDYGGPTERREKWLKDRDLKEFPTDAYGMLFFRQEPKGVVKVAHYIRLSDDTKIWRSKENQPSVLDLMVDTWKLLEPEAPKLVISFTGDEERFSLEGAKKKTFMAGLIRAVESTNAWLLTDGSDAGISKVVGQTVNEMQTTTKADGRLMPSIKCIGVTSYGACTNKDALINAEEVTENDKHFYDVIPSEGRVQKVALNSDHTHFLLVDDGFHNTISSADIFRSRLEEGIQKTIPDGGLDIPVVMLLLDGGLRALDRCLKALRRRVPVVVVQGSGRAADLLADAVLNHDNERSDESAVKELLSKVPVYIPDLDSSQHMECAKKVVDCSKTGNKITVYDINGGSTMDKAILSALLTGSADLEDELRLALQWDRADVAESSILPQIEDNADLSEVMRQALTEEKIDFIDLLLVWGFDISQFLTVEELRKLYNLNEPKVHLKMLRVQGADDMKISLSDVDKLLNRLVGTHVHQLYHDKNIVNKFCSTFIKTHFQDPFMELFIWSILTRRNKLAEYLWDMCNYPLSAAVVATCIYNGILGPLTDSELREESQAMKDMFEEKATELGDLGYKKNYINAMSLLQQKYPRWGNQDSLELALMGEDMRFASSPAARAVKAQQWKNVRMKFWARIIYRLLLFVTHCMLVLFNLDQKPTFLEIILASVIASEAVEKIILMMQASSQRRSYGNSAWHLYDIILLVTFLSAFTIRTCNWIPEFGYVLYAVCVPLFSLRLLRFLYVWPRLGSKILIFVHMVPRLAEFLTFLVVFVLGYGIAMRVLVSSTCRNRHYLSFSLRSITSFISEVIFAPYWQMFGELQLDSINAPNRTMCEGEMGYWRWLTSCDSCKVVADTVQPTIFNFFARVMLAFYLLLANVLLLNLIIAIFTTIYEQVQMRTIEHWNFEMHRLTREYEHKPAMPPPFGVFAYGWRGIKMLLCREENTEVDAEDDITFDEEGVWLNQFERQQVRSYLLMRTINEEMSLENTLNRLNKMIESLPSILTSRYTGREDATLRPKPSTIQRPPSTSDLYAHANRVHASSDTPIFRGKAGLLDHYMQTVLSVDRFTIDTGVTQPQVPDSTAKSLLAIGEKSHGILKQMALQLNFLHTNVYHSLVRLENAMRRQGRVADEMFLGFQRVMRSAKDFK